MRHIPACFIIINKTKYFRLRLCDEVSLRDLRETLERPKSFGQTMIQWMHIVNPWAPIGAKNNQHWIWEKIGPISFSLFLSTIEDAGSIKYINQDCLGSRSSQSYSLRISSRNTISIVYTIQLNVSEVLLFPRDGIRLILLLLIAPPSSLSSPMKLSPGTRNSIL